MKTNLIAFTLFICSCILTEAQGFTNTSVRFIEVTGSAEMEIEPDEIKLIIGIQEYWKEEFEKKKEFEDYKTKVPIDKIEQELLSDLAGAGIDENDIVIQQVGNYWRHKGKEFLISKQYELTLNDFGLVNQIIGTLDTKGINYMRIGELTNKNIHDYRKQLKINALKAAEEKAAYLLAGIGEELGPVLSVVETVDVPGIWRSEMAVSNVAMESRGNSGIENFRKINLRYEIKAKYYIKPKETN